ncbi:MAG: TlpA disulfide reductase family protein [Gammaproteobacteria bacterium]
MKSRSSLIAGCCLLLLALTTWLWLSHSNLTRAPEVSFKTINGRQITMASLRGNPVLVTFWATTCPGCIKEMPHLVDLYHELRHSGFEIIGVAMAYDPPNQVVEMVERRKIPYPITLDIDGSLARAFNYVTLTPTSFLVAPDGQIVQHEIGEMNIKKLRAQIENLLSQQLLAISHKPPVANSL